MTRHMALPADDYEWLVYGSHEKRWPLFARVEGRTP